MTIDCHAHWIPPRMAELLRRRRHPPCMEPVQEDEQFVTWQGRRPLRPLGDLAARLDEMERHGVRAQVLSLASLFGVDCLPVPKALPLVQAFNEAAAQACREHPERLAALAALPCADVLLACRELERAHEMGLRGAILPADAFRTRAAAERLRPLFNTGDRLRSHFFIHPGPAVPQPPGDLRVNDEDNAWQRRIVLQTQATLSETVFTLCLSGFLEPYDGLTVQVANLGGAIPFLLERMQAVQRARRHGDAAHFEKLRRCYVDTASFGSRGIEAAVACFGADRVLLGSDAPIFEMPRMLDALTGARLDPASRDLIEEANARWLFGRF